MQDKILIVDDEQEIADLVSLYLTNEGFQVFKFYNAADAWSCIQTENLDLAILDVMLPDMNGFELCQKIREKYQYPVIMLTAKGEGIDKITGLTLGADDYITICLASLAQVNGKEYILVTAKANGTHQTEQFHILDAINVYSQIGEAGQNTYE